VTVKGQRHIETQAGTPCEALPGRCLGERFEVEGMVGSGGMGVVFRCRDQLDGGTVAVKLLQRREYLTAERFPREAATLASLNHPAIVRYIAHGITPQGEPYLAMEWLHGETLADRIARGPIDPRAVARLGARILQALAVAHAHRIVHRDLKPTNIFLPGADVEQAKLLDFGIAQRAQDDWHITRPGGAMGTPVYMPPEQFRDGSTVDGRADVFSLACVLVESLVGESARACAQECAAGAPGPQETALATRRGCPTSCARPPTPCQTARHDRASVARGIPCRAPNNASPR
jgi:serine/threonine protein kinase